VSGRNIQQYCIRALIGEGTLGTVYAAQHPAGGRRAALKVLHQPLDRDAATAFIDDARAAQALRHPHLVDILEVGVLPAGQPYLMTELLVGETLGERLRRVGTLPVADVLDFGAQAASALDAAHQQGLMHGRLTREDLFLVPDLSMARGERVKVLDLGTGRVPSGSAGDIPAGSAPYRAPEAEPDHRADIYALAGLLYHALCGTPPFAGNSASALAQAHLCDRPIAPRALNREIPSHVSAALMKALSRRPADRFPTMSRFIDALGRRGRVGPRLDHYRAASLLVVLAFSGTLLWSVRSRAGWQLRRPWQELLSPARPRARSFATGARPPAIIPLPDPMIVGPPALPAQLRASVAATVRPNTAPTQQHHRARTLNLWERRH
jgi:serine/threonine protein kinase